ncbi:hypothetical protein EJ08DRAFT_698172 [Tothia fuscella]|uniref:Uncharacterized protein n=1 Tax=Tothia fuscella TaxID=1048955 RepID=A0A9P4NQ60_9PEZI|nr:hypothetical protein EJ08DRAFT_698172 [Tothia fuscella]
MASIPKYAMTYHSSVVSDTLIPLNKLTLAKDSVEPDDVGSLSLPAVLPHLPVELTTMIADLLEHSELSQDNDYQWPIHTVGSIGDILSVRTLCKSFYVAALPAYGRLLGEVKWSTTPGSIQTLLQISLSPRLAEHMRTLTFNNRDFSSTSPANMGDLQEVVEDCVEASREMVSTGRVFTCLTTVFDNLPNLKNLRIDKYNTALGRWPLQEILDRLHPDILEHAGTKILERCCSATKDNLPLLFKTIKRAGTKLEMLMGADGFFSEDGSKLMPFFPLGPLGVGAASAFFANLRTFQFTIPENYTYDFGWILTGILADSPNLKELNCSHELRESDSESFHTLYIDVISLVEDVADLPKLKLLDLEHMHLDEDSLLAITGQDLKMLRLAECSFELSPNYVGSPLSSEEQVRYILTKVIAKSSLEVLKFEEEEHYEPDVENLVCDDLAKQVRLLSHQCTEEYWDPEDDGFGHQGSWESVGRKNTWFEGKWLGRYDFEYGSELPQNLGMIHEDFRFGLPLLSDPRDLGHRSTLLAKTL